MPTKNVRRKPFDDVFVEALQEIEKDAERQGIPLIALAGQVGISRAQFARWRKRPPATIQVMAKLQAALDDSRES